MGLSCQQWKQQHFGSIYFLESIMKRHTRHSWVKKASGNIHCVLGPVIATDVLTLCHFQAIAWISCVPLCHYLSNPRPSLERLSPDQSTDLLQDIKFAITSLGRRRRFNFPFSATHAVFLPQPFE